MTYYISDIAFNVPIINASGCWSINKEQIHDLYNSSLGAVVSKTTTLESKKGNNEPTYYYDKDNNIHFNSKGLPNNGYYYYRDISTNTTNKPYIISLAYDDYANLQIILNDYNILTTKKVLVEINMSCPNLDKRIPGYNLETIRSLLHFLQDLNVKNIYFGLKLPPFLELHIIADLAKELNNFTTVLKYIVVSNSIPNTLPIYESKPTLSNIYGGMSGKLNKSIALSNVYTFSKYLTKNITIVGCGGIETYDDIKDYLNNGATFVQVASCFYDEKSNKLDINKINNVIEEFVKNTIKIQ